MLSLLRFLDPNFPGKSPTDMRIPPLKTKTLLESSPLKSTIFVQRLAARPVRGVRIVEFRGSTQVDSDLFGGRAELPPGPREVQICRPGTPHRVDIYTYIYIYIYILFVVFLLCCYLLYCLVCVVRSTSCGSLRRTRIGRKTRRVDGGRACRGA